MFDVTNAEHRKTVASYCHEDDVSDEVVAAWLNAIKGDPACMVSKGDVSRDTFIAEWADILDALRGFADIAIRDKWLWRIQYLLLPKESITLDGPTFVTFLREMIADGLLTEDQADAKVLRQGSAAEKLFGSGTLLTGHDVWMGRLEGQK